MPLSTTKQSCIPAIYEQLTTSTSPENVYDEVTRIIINCDECSTYLQNNFDCFVNIKIIAKKTTAPTFVTS